MFHSSTQRLVDYWRSIRSGDEAPARAAFDPARLADVLPQLFVVGKDGDRLPFRLAGGLPTDLHGRGLRGEDFAALWSAQGRGAVAGAVFAAIRDREPVVLRAEGVTADGQPLGLEIVLAPLTGPSGEIDRLVGLYQPTTTVARLRGRPIVELHPRLTVYAAPQAEPHLKLAAVDGRRIA